MKGGSASLAEYAREAEQLGIALNNFEVARIEQANDALNRGKQAVAGLTNKFTVALAPVIEVIADLFTDWVKSVDLSSEVAPGASSKGGPA